MPELPPRPIPLDNLPIQMLARQAPSGPSPPPDAKANARGHEMDASECQGLATSILLDLLSDTSEEKLAAKRQESVRTALIARLATHEAEGSDFHHAVLDHVLPKWSQMCAKWPRRGPKWWSKGSFGHPILKKNAPSGHRMCKGRPRRL